MYTLVRRYIKTAVAFLFAGITLGAWMLVRRELFGVWPDPYLVSVHAHAVLFGFIVFMILGVALWLFPRPAKGDRRYRPGWVAAAYWILLASTLARLGGESLRAARSGGPVLGWVVVAGGLGQIVGLALYFSAMWSRIRPVGSHLREAKGERF